MIRIKIVDRIHNNTGYFPTYELEDSKSSKMSPG